VMDALLEVGDDTVLSSLRALAMASKP